MPRSDPSSAPPRQMAPRYSTQSASCCQLNDPESQSPGLGEQLPRSSWKHANFISHPLTPILIPLSRVVVHGARNTWPCRLTRAMQSAMTFGGIYAINPTTTVLSPSKSTLSLAAERSEARHDSQLFATTHTGLLA